MINVIGRIWKYCHRTTRRHTQTAYCACFYAGFVEKGAKSSTEKKRMYSERVCVSHTECNAEKPRKREEKKKMAWDSILHATETLSHLFRLNKLKLKRKIRSIRSRNAEFNQFACAVLLFLSVRLLCFGLFVSFSFVQFHLNGCVFGLNIFICLYFRAIGLCCVCFASRFSHNQFLSSFAPHASLRVSTNSVNNIF